MKLFFIGMMGTGKTFWTQKMAKKLKIGGYDLDFLIEAHEEKSITEIFSEHGEPYFRRTEAKILRWFKEKKAFVLATGGGTPCFSENMDWMNGQGVTIWIDEPITILVERLLPEKAQRPLIKGLSDNELHQFLTNKLIERYPFYQRAIHHLQGNNINEKEITKIIKQYA